MSTRSCLAIAILAAAFSTVPAVLREMLVTAHAQPAPAGGTRVAVVNLERMFLGYTKSRDKTLRLQKDFEEEKRKLADRKAALDGRKQDLESKRDRLGEAEFRAQARALAEDEAIYNVEAKMKSEEIQTRVRAEAETTYNRIVDGVAKYAKARGYDLVLKVHDVPEHTRSNEALVDKLNRRTILFHADGVDITDAVLTELNR